MQHDGDTMQRPQHQRAQQRRERPTFRRCMAVVDVACPCASCASSFPPPASALSSSPLLSGSAAGASPNESTLDPSERSVTNRRGDIHGKRQAHSHLLRRHASCHGQVPSRTHEEACSTSCRTGILRIFRPSTWLAFQVSRWLVPLAAEASSSPRPPPTAGPPLCCSPRGPSSSSPSASSSLPPSDSAAVGEPSPAASRSDWGGNGEAGGGSKRKGYQHTTRAP